MSSIEELLDELNSDMESGAKELVLKAIRFLKQVIQTGKTEYVSKFIDGLKRVKPTMAPIQNLRIIFNVFIELPSLDLDKALSIVEKIEELVEGSNEQIYSNLLDLMSLTRSTNLMTISRSSTVEYVIQRLCREETLGKVFVPASYPLNEGVTLARNLTSAGCNVHLIPDFAVAHYAQDAGLILVGADAVTLNGFANKIGTKTLAIIASQMEIPFLVLADFLKIKLWEEPLKFELIDAFPDVKNVGIETKVPLFEFVKHDFVTMYVTNIGVFKGSEMANVREKIGEILRGLV